MPSYPDRPSLQGDRPTGSEQGVESPRSRLGVGVCVCVCVCRAWRVRGAAGWGVCVCVVLLLLFSGWVVHSLTAIPEKSQGPSAREPDTAALGLSPGLLSRLLEPGSCAGYSLHNSRTRAPSLA